MALHQHLADTGDTTEVSVDLERGMGVEEIGIGTATLAVVGDAALLGCYGSQQLTVDMMGFLAVFQSCPEVDAPTRAPTGGLVTLDLQ